MQNCNINSDRGQHRIARQLVWKITTTSVLTMDKIEVKDNHYGELQKYQF